MAGTIASFLVGMGLDTSDLQKSAKAAMREIHSMRAAILQANAAAGKIDFGGLGAGAGASGGFDVDIGKVSKIGTIASVGKVAGAVGVVGSAIGGIAISTANATNKLQDFAEIQSVSENQVQSLGFAAEKFGGSLQEVMSDLQRMDEIRNTMPNAVGEIFSDLGIRGVDASQFLNAPDANEAYLKLAELMESQDIDGRNKLNQFFGLSGGTIRLMSQGRSEIEAMTAEFEKVAGKSREHMELSKEYRNSLVDVKANFTGLFNEISENSLPAINKGLSALNEFVTTLREGAKIPESTKTSGSPMMMMIGSGSKEKDITDLHQDIKDFLNTDHSNSGIALPSYMTAPTPVYDKYSKPTANQNNQTKTPIKVEVTLDGKVLGTAVTDIVEQQNNAAMEEVRQGGR